jgi:2',3'-cyclic-nucleotide 2'-phosphodiesterase (5'-nucleotidase family)
MHSIHPDLLARVQPYTTSTRRQVRRQEAGLGGGPKSHSGEIEVWAREALRRDPSLDLVVARHSHLPVKIEVDAGRYYLNAGEWITHFTFAEIPADTSPPVVRRWSGVGSTESTQ